MTLDHRLLDMLVCPICKSPLAAGREADTGPLVELRCRADRLAFPIRDGIPVMLEAQARALPPEEAPAPALTLAQAAPGAN